MDKTYICPVCGYDKLWFEPYIDYSNPATGCLEICPSCGFQFGVSDLAKGNWTWNQWREKWVKEGAKWDSVGITPPPNWNPWEQMKNIPSEFLDENSSLKPSK